jgi:WD40 repeat protein
LAVSTLTSLLLHEGVTLNEIKTINYGAGLQYSSLSFSQDDSMMAVGFSSDKGTCNYAIYSTSKTGEVEDNINELQEFTGKVNGICFSADNSHLVMGSSNG